MTPLNPGDPAAGARKLFKFSIDVGKRVFSRFGEKGLGVTAAGVAFFAFLALFPGAAVGFSLYGIFSDPVEVANQLELLHDLMPKEALSLVEEELMRLAEASGGTLGWGLLISLLAGLWSANKGVKALTTALNVTFGTLERRNFIQTTALNLGLTLAFILAALLAVAAMVALPAIAALFRIPPEIEWITRLASFALVGVIGILLLSTLYAIGPDRRPLRWSAFTPGSVAACALWVVVSILFSWFVKEFGNFSKTYGTLGSLIVLMLWMLNTAQLVLLGACLNAELQSESEANEVGA